MNPVSILVNFSLFLGRHFPVIPRLCSSSFSPLRKQEAGKACRLSWGASFKYCFCITGGRWPNRWKLHILQWKYIILRKISEDRRAKKDLNLLRSLQPYIHKFVQKAYFGSSFKYCTHRTEFTIIQTFLGMSKDIYLLSFHMDSIIRTLPGN